MGVVGSEVNAENKSEMIALGVEEGSVCEVSVNERQLRMFWSTWGLRWMN